MSYAVARLDGTLCLTLSRALLRLATRVPACSVACTRSQPAPANSQISALLPASVGEVPTTCSVSESYLEAALWSFIQLFNVLCMAAPLLCPLCAGHARHRPLWR